MIQLSVPLSLNYYGTVCKYNCKMVQLNYEAVGSESEKSPIFCLHTVPLDRNYILNSLKGVKTDRKIICVDLPNHGKSDNINHEDLDFKRMADEINYLRENLGYNKISLLGHGVGGFVVLYFAVFHPEFVESIALVNTAGNRKYRDTMAWNIRERYSKVTRQALDEYYGKTDDKSVRARFTQSFAVYFNPTNHELAKELMNSADRISTETYVYLSRNVIEQYYLREKIREIDKDVLIMASMKDVWPIEASQHLRNDLPHATFKQIDTGHFPMIEKPEQFWNIIFEFLNK